MKPLDIAILISAITAASLLVIWFKPCLAQ